MNKKYSKIIKTMKHGNVNVRLVKEIVIQIKSKVKINVDANVKKHNVSEKGYICNPIHVVSKTVNM